MSWSAPTNLPHPALVFAVGFETAEVFAPGEFFDSFTVTVRDSSNSFVAPIVTMDAVGTTFAPENPGGTQLVLTAIHPESLAFPVLDDSRPFRSAWLVMLVLPPQIVAQSGTLRLSLFNNDDLETSMGFVNHVQVVPGPGTLLVLESSAAADGPYGLEGSVKLRHARRSLSTPATGGHRFFKLEAGTPTEIAGADFSGSEWVFRYTGGDPHRAPRLLSSAQVAGPYAQESGVLADLPSGTLRIPKNGAARFFRLRSETPLAIRKLTREGGNIIMRYE